MTCSSCSRTGESGSTRKMKSVIAVQRIFSLKGIFRSGCATSGRTQRTGFTSVRKRSWLGMTTRQSMNSLSTEYCVGETVLCRRDRRRFLPTHDYSSGEWD